MTCAYCSELMAQGVDEFRRPVCPACLALDQPSYESLRIAEMMIELAIRSHATQHGIPGTGKPEIEAAHG